jgi:hypothetical protein
MAEKFSVVFVLNFMEDGVLKVQLLEQIEKFWKYRKEDHQGITMSTSFEDVAGLCCLTEALI